MQKETVYKIFIIIALIGISYAFAQFFSGDWGGRFSTADIEVEEEVEEKLDIEKLVVQSFEAKKELITSEAELTEEATWDESWGDIGLFKKKQGVRFYGTGIYTCDLNKIKQSDIIVDEDNKTIEVTIPKPVIKSVTIHEEKSEYEDVEKGWLRFGDIKLTQEQYGEIYHAIKEAMEKKLGNEEYYARAEKNSKEAVKQIFNDILSALKQEYTVTVK